MLLGYMRVSKADGSQVLDLQRDALHQAGCDRIFTDVISGVQAERPGLADALAFLRAGDSLVIWKLDRLGRSLKDLIEKMTVLQARRECLINVRDDTLREKKTFRRDLAEQRSLVLADGFYEWKKTEKKRKTPTASS